MHELEGSVAPEAIPETLRTAEKEGNAAFLADVQILLPPGASRYIVSILTSCSPSDFGVGRQRYYLPASLVSQSLKTWDDPSATPCIPAQK